AAGERDSARATLADARQAVAACPDPGILADMLAAAERRIKVARLASGSRGDHLRDQLTARELAVLHLLRTDHSLRSIAAQLYVSQNTVKTHTRSVYRKLNAATRAEAVGRARELNLL